jgi:resuscitation-promoting factor RpfA
VANGTRPPVAPVRKVAAAVLATVAAFVMLFGAGLRSWSAVAIGAALLVLAIGLMAVTAARGGAQAWVLGTAHVHSVSEPPASSTFGRCEMQLVIDAPGLSIRSVKVRDPRVPVAKWPDPGATLPVTVALDDPRRVRILWDEVLTHAEAAEAEAVAAGGAAAGGGPGRPAAEEIYVARRSPPEPDLDAPLGPPVTDPVTMDLTEELRDLRPISEEVVIYQPPDGPPIIEGTVVDPPNTIPLPRRATTGDRYAQRADSDAYVEEVNPGVATAAEPPLIPEEIMTDDPPADATDGGGLAGVGVTLLVADLDRSVRFYCDLLGLSDVDRGETSAVLASGSTRLVLRAIRGVAPVDRRLVHLNLEVADIERAYARLADKGVRFTYPPRVVNRGAKLEVWAAAFRDPDGHGVALTEWRDRAVASPSPA